MCSECKVSRKNGCQESMDLNATKEKLIYFCDTCSCHIHLIECKVKVSQLRTLYTLPPADLFN